MLYGIMTKHAHSTVTHMQSTGSDITSNLEVGQSLDMQMQYNTSNL